MFSLTLMSNENGVTTRASVIDTGVDVFYYLKYGLLIHVYINTRTKTKVLVKTIVLDINRLKNILHGNSSASNVQKHKYFN